MVRVIFHCFLRGIDLVLSANVPFLHTSGQSLKFSGPPSSRLEAKGGGGCMGDGHFGPARQLDAGTR